MKSSEIKKMARERMTKIVDIVVQDIYGEIEKEAKLGHFSMKFRMGDVEKETQRYLLKCLKKDFKVRHLFSDIYVIEW
ncbi:hypothetical protein MOC12_20815 [Bacillus spizizenii]|nr:hypothetical protein [Bacillus spizizenii]